MNREFERNGDTLMLNLQYALILLVFIASGIEPLLGRFAGLQALGRLRLLLPFGLTNLRIRHHH